MLGQLAKENIEVAEVILLDSHLPNYTLKVIEKTRGFIWAILSMVKIECTQKEVFEFSKKVLRQLKSKRKDFIYDFIVKKGGKIDKEFFYRMFSIYTSSMGVSYQLKNSQNVKTTLVTAKQKASENKESMLDWTPYFKSIEVIESTGSHFELIKKPFVNIWKNTLDEKRRS